MRGDLARLRMNCGRRNSGWLASFQIDHTETRSPKRRPTAVANAWNSSGLGLVRLSRFPFVAQRGTGPVSVSWTVMPRAWADANSSSRRDHVPAGYAAGSVASKAGRRLELAAGA